MTRTDELTNKLIDGTLSAEDWAELDMVLALDASAEADHLQLVELEAALRGMREGFDLSACVQTSIDEAQSQKTTAAVMAGIAAVLVPPWATSRQRTKSRRLAVSAATLFAIAAGVIVAIWFGGQTPIVQIPQNNPPATPASRAFAQVVYSSGVVEFLSPTGQVSAAIAGNRLPVGHTLRTIGEDSVARVEFQDRTTVEIEPDSVVRFVSMLEGAKVESRIFLASGQLRAEFGEGNEDRSLVVGTGVADIFAHTGMLVVASSGPESVRVDVKRGNVEVLRTDTSARVSVADGGAFFQAGFEHVGKEPSFRYDEQPARSLQLPGPQAARFSPDGSEVWIASGKQFTRWTRDGGTAETVFALRKGHDGMASFGLNPATLVTFINSKEDSVHVRKLPDGMPVAEFNLQLPERRFWTFSPSAEWFAVVESRTNNRKVVILDGSIGEKRLEREFETNVNTVAASPDGRMLAIGLNDLGRGTHNKVVLMNPANGDRIATLPTQRKNLMAMTFSGDGRYLAVGFNGMVQLWDVQSRDLLLTFTGFERIVSSLAFSADGQQLAVGTQDGQVWLWSVATGQPFQVLQAGRRGLRSLAFDPEGKRLVTVGHESPVRIWNIIASTATKSE